jgi:hypothetical protein
MRIVVNCESERYWQVLLRLIVARGEVGRVSRRSRPLPIRCLKGTAGDVEGMIGHAWTPG